MNREEAKKRATALVAQMTLEEKASQLRYDAPPIKRLGIPAYNWWNEGLHGVARAGISTVFPQAIGMAATFDEDLVGEMAEVVATEGRAKYNANAKHNDRDIYKGLTFWSPNINIFRDPRWGRGHETYGEDPFLSARLGVSYVKHLQGDGEYMKAAACAKHFAVHSGPEAIRHEFDVYPSMRDLEATYLPAFETLVKEGHVEAVMGAYNRVNGQPCAGNDMLVKDYLRGKWGFEGHFVSDCWAIRDFHEHHMVTNTPAESAAMALNTGCDLNCGNTYLHILRALEKGLTTEEKITEAAIRLYTTRFLLGLFDKTEFDGIPYSVIECKEHLDLADKAALESPVLLKNQVKEDGSSALPLHLDQIHTIGVVGPNANSRSALIGNYHGTSSEYVTVSEGIQEYVRMNAPDVRVLFSEGCNLSLDRTEPLAQANDRIAEAVSVAENSDVVILVVGLDETLEGEEGDTGNSYVSGDKEDLEFPLPQKILMEAIAKTEKPVILCNMTGSSMNLGFAQEHFDAILQLWYPGARGGRSIAKLLFGDVSPSGKLPVTFYHSTEELPDFEDYGMDNRTYRYMQFEPLYPFGYGLTYSDVRVTAIEQTPPAEDGYLTAINVTAKNFGSVETDDVIQLYVKADSPYAPPNPVLCGFRRIHLKPGEEITTHILVRSRSLSVINEDGQRIYGATKCTFYAGMNQPDQRSKELTSNDWLELPTTVDYR